VYKQTHKKGWHPPAPKQLPTKKQKKKKKISCQQLHFWKMLLLATPLF
jgi:hypothetical protein